jgi:hypothetical protein
VRRPRCGRAAAAAARRPRARRGSFQRLVAAPPRRVVGLRLVKELAAQGERQVLLGGEVVEQGAVGEAGLVGHLAGGHVGEAAAASRRWATSRTARASLLGFGRDPHRRVLNVSALAISGARRRGSSLKVSTLVKNPRAGRNTPSDGEKGKGPDRRPVGQVPSTEGPAGAWAEDRPVRLVCVGVRGKPRQAARAGAEPVDGSDGKERCGGPGSGVRRGGAAELPGRSAPRERAQDRVPT